MKLFTTLKLLCQHVTLAGIVSLCLINHAAAQKQESSTPPGLNEATSGKPAVIDEQATNSEQSKTHIKNNGSSREYRRENGQVYRIEIDTAIGGKQYMDETDSDGKIESTDNGIEQTPNLPKWKIGSW